MTTIEEKTHRLITTLIEKTRRNKVVWEKTLSKRMYKTDLNGDGVMIRHIPDWVNEAYSLSIQRGDLDLVEVIREPPGSEGYTQMAQMFTLARTSADRNVEEGIDRLLQELESR